MLVLERIHYFVDTWNANIHWTVRRAKEQRQRYINAPETPGVLLSLTALTLLSDKLPHPVTNEPNLKPLLTEQLSTTTPQN